MSLRPLLMLSLTEMLAAVTLSPHAAFAQFPPPPPMAGPPPPAAGSPPAFAARPPMGPGGALRAGLGAGPALRGDLAAAGRGGPAVANATRATSVTHTRGGGYGRYGESRYGYRAAYAASAYAGAAAGYAYGSSRYSSESDCYYIYRRYRRVMVCE